MAPLSPRNCVIAPPHHTDVGAPLVGALGIAGAAPTSTDFEAIGQIPQLANTLKP